MKQYALSWIKSHPTAFVDLTIKRFGLYFHVKTDWFTVPYGWKNILINKMGFEARYHTFLFYSFFLGLVLIRRRKLQLIMVAAAVFYFIGLSSLFYVSPGIGFLRCRSCSGIARMLFTGCMLSLGVT